MFVNSKNELLIEEPVTWPVTTGQSKMWSLLQRENTEKTEKEENDL